MKKRKGNSRSRTRWLAVLTWNFVRHRFEWSRCLHMSEVHEEVTNERRKDFAASGFLSREVER